jgi:hypothetical protein
MIVREELGSLSFEQFYCRNFSSLMSHYYSLISTKKKSQSYAFPHSQTTTLSETTMSIPQLSKTKTENEPQNGTVDENHITTRTHILTLRQTLFTHLVLHLTVLLIHTPLSFSPSLFHSFFFYFE